MKFAHIADSHIGGWREESLKELSIKVFEEAIKICVKENTAFVLIAGDLFDTSLPNIDIIKRVASALNELKEHDISTYIIPGSHDYSPSGKTMLDVLEKSGLVENVFKFKDNNLEFTLDKTNTKITGIHGLKTGLDRSIYSQIKNKGKLEQEKGFKIFMFHCLLSEFKPKNLDMVEAQSYQDLPKNFTYYAGGHPHFVFKKKKEGYGLITYPGPLMPNNFKELEELKQGGFYIVDDKLNINFIPIKLKEVSSFNISADDKTALEVEKELMRIKNVKDKIVTIRIKGELKEGKPSDIDFKEVLNNLKEAYVVLKNTGKLTTKEFEALKVKTGDVKNVEEVMIKENLGQVKVDFNEEKIIKQLMLALNLEKGEGERNIDFEDRLVKDILKVLDLKEIFEK